MSLVFFKNTPFQINFRYQLSWILVPLAVYLYIYANSIRPIILYHIIIIAIIGSIDTLYSIKTNGFFVNLFSMIFHLSLLFVFPQFNQYGYFNIGSFLLLILANIILFSLPIWPYSMTRYTIFLLYNGIYLALLLAFFKLV